jgi:hypothetical protein
VGVSGEISEGPAAPAASTGLHGRRVPFLGGRISFATDADRSLAARRGKACPIAHPWGESVCARPVEQSCCLIVPRISPPLTFELAGHVAVRSIWSPWSADTRRSGAEYRGHRPRCRSVGRRAGPIESTSTLTMVTSGDVRSDQGMYRYSPPFTISTGVRCSAASTSPSPSSRCRDPSPGRPAHHRGHGTLARGW